MSEMIWQEPLPIGGHLFTAEEVIERLGPHMTNQRRARVAQVVEARTRHVVPILENIFDRGNISAVMRSAESFGLLHFHIVEFLNQRFKAANRVSAGTEKWLDVREFGSVQTSLDVLRNQGYQVWATHLEAEVTLEELDLSRPVAFVFGNEKHGVSSEMMEKADGRVVLPMAGFAQSFNISVAAALFFYHAHLYLKKNPKPLSPFEKRLLTAQYYLRSVENSEKILLEPLKQTKQNRQKLNGRGSKAGID